MFRPCPTNKPRHNFHVLDLFFKEINAAIEDGTFVNAAAEFDKTYSTEQAIDAGARGPRVRGHHTALRREQKKRKLPVAKNKGLVGKETSVLSGGEIIERQGKRKHWRQFPSEDGIVEDGVESVDEEDHVVRELLLDEEIERTTEKVGVERE